MSDSAQYYIISKRRVGYSFCYDKSVSLTPSLAFQVKWSDSSSTAVTKSHRELQDFLVKVFPFYFLSPFSIAALKPQLLKQVLYLCKSYLLASMLKQRVDFIKGLYKGSLLCL